MTARLHGGDKEVALPIELRYPSTSGAPMPVILCTQTEVTLLNYVSEAAGAVEDAVGKLTFRPCSSMYQGEPNDEALPKRRLWGVLKPPPVRDPVDGPDRARRRASRSALRDQQPGLGARRYMTNRCHRNVRFTARPLLHPRGVETSAGL
jgi:hypothetical protein